MSTCSLPFGIAALPFDDGQVGRPVGRGFAAAHEWVPALRASLSEGTMDVQVGDRIMIESNRVGAADGPAPSPRSSPALTGTTTGSVGTTATSRRSFPVATRLSNTPVVSPGSHLVSTGGSRADPCQASRSRRERGRLCVIRSPHVAFLPRDDLRNRPIALSRDFPAPAATPKPGGSSPCVAHNAADEARDLGRRGSQRMVLRLGGRGARSAEALDDKGRSRIRGSLTVRLRYNHQGCQRGWCEMRRDSG